MRLETHKAHDYAVLQRRWRAIAARARLVLQRYHNVDGVHLYCLVPRCIHRGAPWIYLSAGVHGDEPAGTEGLAAWAEGNSERFASVNPMIFPCLNPWGLVNNCRTDSAGRDLNRLFHRTDLPLFAAWRARLGARRFALALNLHEDFDGQGVYVYELHRGNVSPWGERIVAAAARHVPVDARTRIDVSRTKAPGVIRRRITRKAFSDFGYPEAVALHFEYARRTLTVETPSEFGLDCRVAAQQAALTAAFDLLSEAQSGK